MSDDRALFDAGLQPERTALAWRRTALSLAVGSLVALRLLPELLGNSLWVIVGFGGIVLAAVLWATSERRYRSFSHERTPRPHTPFGAWPLLLLAVCSFLLGLGAIVLAVIASSP